MLTAQPSRKVYLDLSQPQHTDAGHLLHQMYYSRPRLLDSLSRDERTGYPHNGGMHTLSLHMTAEDLLAFRALVQQDFSTHRGLAEFLADFDSKFDAQLRRRPVH